MAGSAGFYLKRVVLYMDTCLEVYPGYQQHRTAMHTVAHFLDIEIWRVAETLSCRIKNHSRPRMYLVMLADYYILTRRPCACDTGTLSMHIA